ncbi:hypothetical protein PROFUN_10485 [Planoprotostelium fungivorum]|uniref:Uncharacterized protein n=1 Tax=Planoprotostelium fungivorum TaxID=1890364 RepID=A0A2P6NDI3_9EUKA|nr:hypothetical protein PROFUN_10485 [Planoprotostelium fungivorum]
MSNDTPRPTPRSRKPSAGSYFGANLEKSHSRTPRSTKEGTGLGTMKDGEKKSKSMWSKVKHSIKKKKTSPTLTLSRDSQQFTITPVTSDTVVNVEVPVSTSEVPAVITLPNVIESRGTSQGAHHVTEVALLGLCILAVALIVLFLGQPTLHPRIDTPHEYYQMLNATAGGMRSILMSNKMYR